MARRSAAVAGLGLVLAAALLVVAWRDPAPGKGASLAVSQLDSNAFGPAPPFMYDNDGERVPWAVTVASSLASSLQVHPGKPGSYLDVWGLKKALAREKVPQAAPAARGKVVHGGRAAPPVHRVDTRDASADGLKENTAEYKETIVNMQHEMRDSEAGEQAEQKRLEGELVRESKVFDARLHTTRASDAQRTQQELANQARRLKAEAHLRAKSLEATFHQELLAQASSLHSIHARPAPQKAAPEKNTKAAAVAHTHAEAVMAKEARQAGTLGGEEKEVAALTRELQAAHAGEKARAAGEKRLEERVELEAGADAARRGVRAREARAERAEARSRRATIDAEVAEVRTLQEALALEQRRVRSARKGEVHAEQVARAERAELLRVVGEEQGARARRGVGEAREGRARGDDAPTDGREARDPSSQLAARGGEVQGGGKAGMEREALALGYTLAPARTTGATEARGATVARGAVARGEGRQRPVPRGDTGDALPREGVPREVVASGHAAGGGLEAHATGGEARGTASAGGITGNALVRKSEGKGSVEAEGGKSSARSAPLSVGSVLTGVEKAFGSWAAV